MTEKWLRAQVRKPSWLQLRMEMEGGLCLTLDVMHFLTGLIEEAGYKPLPWSRMSPRKEVRLMDDMPVIVRITLHWRLSSPILHSTWRKGCCDGRRADRC